MKILKAVIQTLWKAKMSIYSRNKKKLLKTIVGNKNQISADRRHSKGIKSHCLYH